MKWKWDAVAKIATELVQNGNPVLAFLIALIALIAVPALIYTVGGVIHRMIG